MRTPKSEDQEEALALITKSAKIIAETEESTSPTSTTEPNPNVSVAKGQRTVSFHHPHKIPLHGKRKHVKTIGNNGGCKKVDISTLKARDDRYGTGHGTMTKPLGKIARICEEMEKIGESSENRGNKEEVNAEAILVPLPIIHEEFRCRSENCFFRTSIRQELIQHIILEHDE